MMKGKCNKDSFEKKEKVNQSLDISPTFGNDFILYEKFK